MTPLDDLIELYQNAPPLMKQLSHALYFGPGGHDAAWSLNSGSRTGVCFSRGREWVGAPYRYEVYLYPLSRVRAHRKPLESIAARIIAITLAQRTKARDVKIYPETFRSALRKKYKTRIEYKRNCAARGIAQK